MKVSCNFSLFFFFVTMRFPTGQKFSSISANCTKCLGLAESKHTVLQMQRDFSLHSVNLQ